MTAEMKHTQDLTRPGTPSTAHTVSAAAALAMHRHACTFIDARPQGLYKLERVSGALSFPDQRAPPPSLSHHACTVVVYDSGSTSLDQPFSKAAAIIRTLMSLHPHDTRFCLLAGGFSEIRATAPSLIDTPLTSETDTLEACRQLLASKPAWATEALNSLAYSASPAAQILPWLYLGSAADACKLDRLETFGITHILNMAAECTVSFPNRFVYQHIPAHDRATFDMGSCFPKICDFLLEVQKSVEHGNSACVLVHCYAGLSRSVAAVLAYLIAHHQYCLSEALSMVQDRRKGACPDNFMPHLRQWELKTRPFSKSSTKQIQHSPCHPVLNTTSCL